MGIGMRVWRRIVAASGGLTLLAVVVGGGGIASADESTEDTFMPDGLAAETAAASCWEIKENNPAAGSGAYWLLTPAMGAPEQFYCDQEHDGGGWALVGKGREGWQEFYTGQGAPSELLNRPSTVTPAYFPTVQLPSRSIDGLLNGQPVSELPDGIRVLRARTADGSTWQNVLFDLRDRDRWVWSLSAVHPLARYRFDGDSWRSGGTVNNFGSNNSFNRVTQGFTAAQAWTSGFGYGSQVSGTNTATTYLWSASGGGNARPYAEVYVRPQLTQETVGWTSIPDVGLAEQTKRAHASSYAAPGGWGVSGHMNGSTAEQNTEVQAFAQSDNTVYVAGNFARVERYVGGRTQVNQAALAAFDASSGDFRPGFDPTFNNQVKSVQILPNGLLLAAGDFTRVNNQTALGTVLLDPVTGDVAPSWDLQIENRLSGGFLSVRSIKLEGDYVYLGGSFTHLSGNGVSNVYARHAARVRWTTGQPDPSWNPEFDGTLVDIDTSADGGRFYGAGYFSNSGSNPANKVAAVRTVAGAPLAAPAWTPTWSASDRSGYQQAIQEVGDVVYAGGSEHSLFGFSTETFARVSGTITYGIGGDFQTIAADQDTVYAGCHCSSWTFQNAFTWSGITPGWEQADRIQWIGAWDARTGDYIPDFDPQYLRSNNAGAWASFIADDGTLWVGGDFTGSRTSRTSAQTSGGFVRFPLNDHTAPPPPQDLTLVALAENSVSLSWTASPEGSVAYEIIRDDRVIATTTQTQAIVPNLGDGRFFVRAADADGNRSASTPVLVVSEEPTPPAILEPLSAGSDWSFRYETQAPDPTWTQSTFDDSSWNTGTAPLGWGSPTINTILGEGVATNQRPLAAYFRNTFELPDIATVETLTISTIADDGAAVYINGTEVGRARLDDGAITHTTYANAPISTTAATNNPLTIEVPRHLLTEGTNTITAQTHLNYRSTPNISFDATVTATIGEPTP